MSKLNIKLPLPDDASWIKSVIMLQGIYLEDLHVCPIYSPVWAMKRYVVLWFPEVSFKTPSSNIKRVEPVNLSNVEVTFVPSTRTQLFLKTTQTLSCWYSLDSPRRVLIFSFLHRFVLAQLATTSIRVTSQDAVFFRVRRHAIRRCDNARCLA